MRFHVYHVRHLVYLETLDQIESEISVIYFAKVFYICLFVIITTHPCRCEEPFPIAIVSDTLGVNDRYCGLYCVHQAGRLSGRNVDLDKLIQPTRMSGEFGSTTVDIVNSCREFGIACRPIAYSSYVDVCILGGPVIVLVKNSPDTPQANHWIMILSARPDSAEVYDPSSGVFRLSAAEFQSLWGGPAILILKPTDGSEVEIIWVVLKIVLICLSLGSAFVIVRTLARTRWHPVLILVDSAIFMAIVAHLVDPAGFANNRKVIAQTDSVFHPRTPSIVTPSDVLASSTQYVFVDARTPPQFYSGRIPGAINIPITSSHWRNERSLKDIPSDAQIVLYCNSKDCPWSDTLAKSSLFQRFLSVSVLEEGVKGYVSNGGTLSFGRP